MAHASWTISTPSEKISASARLVKKNGAGAGSSFAAVMAKEQTETGASKAASAKTPAKNSQNSDISSSARPMVARLPESGLPLPNNMVLAGRSPSDLLRAQNFNKAQSDLQQTRAVDNFMQNAARGATSLSIARGMNAARNLRTIAASNNGKGFALSASDFIRTNSTANASRVSRSKKASKSAGEEGIGKLSARFESGADGIAAIGYDRTGGTSYGKYQIASKVGSMKGFLAFLDGEAPDLSRRLRSAGPANTGSRRGAMPDEWRAIAKEQPERFEKLQEAYIHESHYKPALKSIEAATGLESASLSPAMREVIWSTAVQHGPAGAAKIFSKADSMSGASTSANYERKLISNVYNVRAGQFGSSTHQVRESVRNRFREEKQLALNLLDAPARATQA